MNINPISINTQVERFFDTQPLPTKSAEASFHQLAQNNLADSAEEVAMMFSESTERKGKAENERTQTAKTKSIFKISQLEELYSLLGNKSETNLQKHIDHILTQKNALTLTDLLEESEGDPAKADVLLRLALTRENTKGQGNEHLQKLATELNTQYGPEVNAGINTAPALADFSQDPHQRHTMRNLYYNAIVGKASVHAVFDALLTQFDENHFNQGLHALIRAMGDDLSSHTPSLPQSQLGLLLRDLKASQQLSQILNHSKDLLEGMKKKRLAGNLSGAALTKKLIDMTQSNVYPREIKNLSDEAVGRDPKGHLLFLNALFPLVKQLPLPIWKGGKARQGVLNLMLRVMDDYTQRERQQIAQAIKKQNQGLS